MNERIRELALQADLIRYPSDEINIKIEKFAELIVLECARELDDRTIFVRGIRAGTWIKEHFGLE